MATLRTRGVWTDLTKLLESPELASADPTAVAEHVRAKCASARGQTLYIADDRDFYSQMGGDYSAASDMADSVNHALGVDRDLACDALIALPVGETARAYLGLVGETLEGRAGNAGENVAKALAGVLGGVTDAVRGSLAGKPVG